MCTEIVDYDKCIYTEIKDTQLLDEGVVSGHTNTTSGSLYHVSK